MTPCDSQVRSAARFVNAEKFIERLENGYDTVVTRHWQPGLADGSE